MHAPDRLDLVLVSADRARPVETRTAEWSWLGWLPHVRPARGQDCRLLLAHDPEQAAARTGELLRRLDETLHEQAARRAAGGSVDEAAAARTPWWCSTVIRGLPSCGRRPSGSPPRVRRPGSTCCASPRPRPPRRPHR
ncbi:hypothetical protein SJI45_19885 [Streptomyces sp. S399]|uniref:hypothetical protein n=1 Tax=Streptomyces sp. S399 TaxID=3096009 RepID=UPI002A8350A5|nr:hypothetical protein [Streptomyces sp. S399]WPR52982.1 hypothetical protein SJI45_19885 [Streptomyces sp. S399]